MKAIVVREFGPPEVLKLETVPDPVPGPGQVLIRMKAAGVNPFETYTRNGTYAVLPKLPYTPGAEGAGVVEGVGGEVLKTRIGDRVWVNFPLTGTNAELVLAHESGVHTLPSSLSFAQGASVYVAYGTAYHAYHHHAKAAAGETVFIHGASGGVGIAAVQMARSLGLTVIGTAGTPEGLELIRKEGAHFALNHSQTGYSENVLEITGGRGADVVLEMRADLNLGMDLRLLAKKGRVVIVGSRGEVTINPRDLLSRRGAIFSFTLMQATQIEIEEIVAGVGAGLENGTLVPVAGTEFPLAEAALAHRKLLEPGALGKLVLVI